MRVLSNDLHRSGASRGTKAGLVETWPLRLTISWGEEAWGLKVPCDAREGMDMTLEEIALRIFAAMVSRPNFQYHLWPNFAEEEIKTAFLMAETFQNVTATREGAVADTVTREA
jgi:hypothetical protein